MECYVLRMNRFLNVYAMRLVDLGNVDKAYLVLGLTIPERLPWSRCACLPCRDADGRGEEGLLSPSD